MPHLARTDGTGPSLQAVLQKHGCSLTAIYCAHLLLGQNIAATGKIYCDPLLVGLLLPSSQARTAVMAVAGASIACCKPRILSPASEVELSLDPAFSVVSLTCRARQIQCIAVLSAAHLRAAFQEQIFIFNVHCSGGTALIVPAATSMSISLVKRPAAVTSAPSAASETSASPAEQAPLQKTEAEAGKVLLPP